MVAMATLMLTYASYRHWGGQQEQSVSELHQVKVLSAPFPRQLEQKSNENSDFLKQSEAELAVKKSIQEGKTELTPLFSQSRVVFADELISQLFDLKQRKDLYPDEIENRVDSILQRLIYQGEDAIPAIQDYLNTLEDMTYAERRVNDRVVDSKSLRISLYEVLDRIGGFEAIDVLAVELQGVRTPLEIAALSDILERQAPGEFREASLKAVTNTYLKISNGELRTTDVSPLFDVLGRFGDSETASQLQELQSDTSFDWRLYATVALANMRDGEGVSALINSPLLNEPRNYQYEVPIRMLAQLAAENSDAQRALIKQVQADKIPDRLWPSLSGSLIGTKEYQLLKPQIENLPTELTLNPFRHQIFGGEQSQTLYIVDNSSNLSIEQIEARIELIDLLLNETTSVTANSALQTSKEFLLRKLP